MFSSNFDRSGTPTSNSSSMSNFPFTNPFEEVNRVRLEQSVLSPNIFHVAHTSTPEVIWKEDNMENTIFQNLFHFKNYILKER